MPSLDRTTLMTTTGFESRDCIRCQTAIYKSYCRQCDEYFHVCKCRPHGHEGHRVYPMLHHPMAEHRAWDAIDQALRGVESNCGSRGPGRMCPCCNCFTKDQHFAYVHAAGCPLLALAAVHKDLTGWLPAGGEPDQPAGYLDLPHQPTTQAKLELAQRERDQAREDAAQAKRFLEDARRLLRQTEDYNARLNEQVYDLTHRPAQLNVAAGVRIELSIGTPQIGWSHAIQCRNCSGNVVVNEHTPRQGFVACPHCRNNLVQQVRALHGL